MISFVARLVLMSALVKVPSAVSKGEVTWRESFMKLRASQLFQYVPGRFRVALRALDLLSGLGLGAGDCE